MKKISAGLIPYRVKDKNIEVMIAHPGGPFFKNKDNGFWSVVKGEVENEEALLETAKREFKEETGIIADGEFVYLGDVVQKSGKTVHAWAFKMDYDLSKGFESNTLEIEWPPKSNNRIVIPEVDKLEYFNLEEAHQKINSAQQAFLIRLKSFVGEL